MASRRVLSDDLKNIEFETSEGVEVTPTFDNMGLREELLRGIYGYGKETSFISLEMSYPLSIVLYYS